MISEHDTTVRFSDDGFCCLKEKMRNRESERKGNKRKGYRKEKKLNNIERQRIKSKREIITERER